MILRSIPKSNVRNLSITSVCLALLSLGCGVGDDLPAVGAAGDTTGIDLALTSVPSTVQCVTVAVTVGTQTITRQFSLTTGASTAALSLGQLPSGAATLRGNAFNVACTALSGATASYVADPLTVTLRPGVVTAVELVFRPNNAVTLSANFLTNVGEIAVGWFASMARMVDGTVRFWGGDQVLGTQTIAGTLPASLGLTNVIQLGVGQNMGCVIKTGGSVVCWGFVNDGNTRIQPTTVNLPSPAVQLSVSRRHSCALLQFGDVACWGSDNSSGQLGNGSTAPAPSSAPAIVALNNQAGVGRLALAASTSCVVDSAGHATCWGDNSSGIFGNGNRTSSLTPTSAAVGLGAITDLKLGDAHACAVRADGTLYCWGSNASGQVGDGTTTDRLNPVPITGLAQVAQVAAGVVHTCAVTQAGQLSCWGANSAGQLGDGTGLTQLAPVPVLSGVAAVRANSNLHTCAEMQDLTVRCWGFNNAGQLGIGSMANSSIPAAVRLQ